MKITKKLEAEILQVMEDYWSSYLHGDLQTWASYLPDDYRNIGITKAEIWNNKKETLADFEKGLDLYYSKSNDQAVAIFKNIVNNNSADSSARLFFQKSNNLFGNNIDENWTGVELMGNK